MRTFTRTAWSVVLLLLPLAAWGQGVAAAKKETATVVWRPVDVVLSAQSAHSWWEFPVTAAFTHAASNERIELEGFWDGDNSYRIRFAPALAGTWTYRTDSNDPGLDGAAGTVVVREPTAAEVRENPNFRGRLRITSDARRFEYADGTPFFFFGDTNWAINTSRCGLGDAGDGPFFEYLADRKEKGFTAILMSFMRGFGDTVNEPAGQRNEGGYPFLEADVKHLNPAYFQALDERMRALWQQGLVTAGHPTWFAKRNCFFDYESAKRISLYLAVRYLAYNHIWSVSGEYQSVFRDCRWSGEEISELGRAVQSHNPYSVLVSVHPGGGIRGGPPYDVQSSRAFHQTDWLDHNWLQTGQSADRMFNVASRLRENYELSPTRPVLMAEGFYERHTDRHHPYHARWQAWTAWLNGAAGYGYGAIGAWQFYDPHDPIGETGFPRQGPARWREAIDFAGAQQLRHVKNSLSKLRWWKLAPARDWLTVDGQDNPMPGPDDISPPHCGAERGRTYVVYVPRGNAAKTIDLKNLDGTEYQARWVDPRSGKAIEAPAAPAGVDAWTLPERPEPTNEDWILILERTE